jgi:hypothetical protein
MTDAEQWCLPFFDVLDVEKMKHLLNNPRQLNPCVEEIRTKTYKSYLPVLRLAGPRLVVSPPSSRAAESNVELGFTERSEISVTLIPLRSLSGISGVASPLSFLRVSITA